MELRIYTKDGKTETLHDVQSITDASGAYYFSFLDGKSLKVYKSQIGAIHIQHAEAKNKTDDY